MQSKQIFPLWKNKDTSWTVMSSNLLGAGPKMTRPWESPGVEGCGREAGRQKEHNEPDLWFEIRVPGSRQVLLFSLCLWESHLTFMRFSFLICKVGEHSSDSLICPTHFSASRWESNKTIYDLRESTCDDGCCYYLLHLLTLHHEVRGALQDRLP